MMDPLLGPARLEPEPVCGSSGPTSTVPAVPTQLGDGGSAQTILDAWLQQLQTDQAEQPVVESRLDLDNLLSSELEFDLDFLTELSSLKGDDTGDGGGSLQELSQELELGLLCPPNAPLEPDPLDLSTLSGPELFPEQPPPAAAQPETAASESAASRATAGEQPCSALPPVASISVVTNKQQGKTVITISTPRGRQSFVLPTADLTQASRVLRALQQKRRRSRLDAAAAADAEVEDEAGVGSLAKEEEESPSADSRHPSVEDAGQRKKPHLSTKDGGDDDPVMSKAMRHLGVDIGKLELSRDEGTKIIACPEPGCDVRFVNMHKLKVHILQHWDYKPYKCPKEGCRWKFFERGKLNRHKATHSRASLKCGEPGCPAAFRTRTNLSRHRLRVHGLSSAPPQPFTTEEEPDDEPEELQELEEPEEEEDERLLRDPDPLALAPYKCTHCGRAFNYAAGLKRHLNWHDRQSSTRCAHPDCSFIASGQSQLRRHERTCHAEKKYRCTDPHCSWAFDSHAKLVRHMTQHTGRRHYCCPYVGCDKSYRRMEYLSNHIRLHLGRYYLCPQKGCRLRFSHQYSLASHIRSAHDVSEMVTRAVQTSDQTIASCPLCPARFKTELYREIHLQDVHGTSSSKDLLPLVNAREDEAGARSKANFNPESLSWGEDADPVVVDDEPTYTVYVPFEVETDSGPSEVLVKCDVSEVECRRLGLELGPGVQQVEQTPVGHLHVLSEHCSAKDTARELRRMGIGILPASLRRTGQSGCARTDITSCHQLERPSGGRQRHPGGGSRKLTDRTGTVDLLLPKYGADLSTESLQLCQTALEEPPSLLCESDLLGSVHDQLQHSTINLSDLS